MCARLLRPVCLITLLVSSLLSSAARAETETELIHRRATLTLKHLADHLDLVEDQWRKEFLREELRGNDGHTLTEEAISRPLVVQQEKIDKALDGLRSHFESWQTGRSDARHVRSSAVRSVQSAIEGCWAVELKKAEFRVEAISQAYKRQHKEFSTERDKRLDALGRRHTAGSAEWESGKARIEKAIAQKEEATVASILDRYFRAANHLADRRRKLCRETWRWESLFENLNRKEDAKTFRILVYSQFAVGLADRSVGLHKDLFAYYTSRDSRLDHFVRHPSSPDRLVLSAWLLDQEKTIYKMDSILLRDPVESLKTEDSTEPPVSVEGTPLEKLIHSLSALLGEMFSLQDRQKSLTAQLAKLNADHRDARFAGKELAKLENDFASCLAVIERCADRQFDRDELANEKSRLEKKAAAEREEFHQARQALEDARKTVTIRRRIGLGDWELDDPATSRGQRAQSRLETLEKEIAKLQAQLAGYEKSLEHADGDRIRSLEADIVLYARLVKQRRDEQRAIESLITRHLVDHENDVREKQGAAARAAEISRKTRATLDRLASASGSAPSVLNESVLKEALQSLDVDYKTFFDDGLVKELLGTRQSNGLHPSLMRGAETLANYSHNLALAEEEIETVRARLTDHVVKLEREMAHCFGELASNDRKLTKITVRVTRLRSAATLVVALSARQLGADGNDPFLEKLDETKKVLDRLGAHIASSLSETVPGNKVEQIPLQTFLDMSMDNEALGWLAEGKRRVTTVTDTLTVLGIKNKPDAMDNAFGGIQATLSIPGSIAEGTNSGPVASGPLTNRFSSGENHSRSPPRFQSPESTAASNDSAALQHSASQKTFSSSWPGQAPSTRAPCGQTT